MATFPEDVTFGLQVGDTQAMILKLQLANTFGLQAGETWTNKGGLFTKVIERVVFLAPIDFDKVSHDETVAESTEVTSATAIALGNLIEEAVACLSSTGESIPSQNPAALVNTMALTDALISGIAVALTSSVTATSTVSEVVELINLVQESMTATATLNADVSLDVTAAVAIVLADIISNALHQGVAEGVTVGEGTVPKLNFLMAVAESTTVAGTFAETLGVYVTVAENVATPDTLAALLKSSGEVSESLGIAVLLGFGGAEFVGYALNSEGEFPASQYTNWPFNSYAKIDKQTFAGQEDGIYEITGADDAGTDIDAHILTGHLDFGNDQQKRILSVQLGYTADDQMRLYVRTEEAGTLKEYWYEAAAITASTPREHVIKLGRGHKSTYWQFKLKNTQGADFFIDTVRLYPILLNRRR